VRDFIAWSYRSEEVHAQEK